MTKLICYANGRFVSLEEATVSVRDLAVLRGYGVFDFLRTYNGKPFKLREHLLRLERSARLILLDLPASLDEIEVIVLDTLHRNNIQEATVRIVVTGGISSDGITPCGDSGLIVLVSPAHLYPASFYNEGIKVITVKLERYIPGAKTINYIPAIVAQKQAKAVGAVEALYVNGQGHILEGTTTNFFIFKGNRLITPHSDILPGVTRNVIVDLAQKHFELVEQSITFDDLAAADEAFITASNKEVMPVHHVNEVQIGQGKPGPNTRQIIADFHELTRGGQPT